MVGRAAFCKDLDLGEATGVVEEGVHPLPGGFGAGLFFLMVRTDGEGDLKKRSQLHPRP